MPKAAAVSHQRTERQSVASVAAAHKIEPLGLPLLLAKNGLFWGSIALTVYVMYLLASS